MNSIGITLGEPAGIGPEIVHKALSSSSIPKDFHYAIFGETHPHRPGELTLASARAAYQALQEAIQAWKTGQISAIVTAPIHKKNMSRIGFSFPGHTEFFSHACGLPLDSAVMVMHDPKLSVALLSAHIPLSEAPRFYTKKRIQQVAKVYSQFLASFYPNGYQIALAGLNPHAGEEGYIGYEEVIAQSAISELQAEGIPISGPYSPDTLYYRAARGDFQGIIAAYHDQALIPFKLLAFSTGVNVTLGLPLIRTSPDHGTALDIAGKNIADPSSMIAAIQLACHLVRTSLNNTPVNRS
ncbi:MAG: 4-hydroxythreonine-4-phosphate dehydrogenase PdxA [Methylacidiphilales bacterium]|nr:4-hydroxythreonine-4-phosphate dehydrogenase PdxA [Candidatus Methylacidiphilales bacterium]MDW8349459.1 4-hydroxythreonine-4-phosphate dehydrogenase PdxA [Verrucomicrobiae bacterium]